MIKKWYQSKTVWLAILQTVAGIIVVVASHFPELQMVGGFMIIKSTIDVILRSLTTTSMEV